MRTYAAALLLCTSFSAAFAAPAAEAPQPMDDDDAPKPPVSSYLKKEAFSFDIAFPAGGSALGTNSIGVRYLQNPNLALALHLQYGFDDTRGFNAYGGTFRTQWFLKSKLRTVLYSFAQMSAGTTAKTAKSTLTSLETGTQLGAAGGMGLELFIMPELSTSVELAVGANALPGNKYNVTTATSGIALHYFFTE
jgi:hypothetical protein